MKIQSARFGELEVGEEQVFTFPHGIPGFPEERSFALIFHGEESSFSFLQSAREANLAFLLVDPFAFMPDYEFELKDEIAEEMNLSRDNLPLVLLIATVKGKVAEMTVNLLAPLVLNRTNCSGRQVILDKAGYSTCHKLFPGGLPVEAAGGGR